MKRWIEAFKRLCGFGRPDCFAIIILMAMIACYGTIGKSIINTPWFLSFIKRAMHHVISNPKAPSSVAVVGASKRKPRKRVFIKSKNMFHFCRSFIYLFLTRLFIAAVTRMSPKGIRMRSWVIDIRRNDLTRLAYVNNEKRQSNRHHALLVFVDFDRTLTIPRPLAVSHQLITCRPPPLLQTLGVGLFYQQYHQQQQWYTRHPCIPFFRQHSPINDPIP